MLEDFKEFIQRGNVLDLAIGLVIGWRSGRSSRRWSMVY